MVTPSVGRGDDPSWVTVMCACIAETILNAIFYESAHFFFTPKQNLRRSILHSVTPPYLTQQSEDSLQKLSVLLLIALITSEGLINH